MCFTNDELRAWRRAWEMSTACFNFPFIVYSELGDGFKKKNKTRKICTQAKPWRWKLAKYSFHERFWKHKASQIWHKNLHSEMSRITLGLADFPCAEAGKPKIGFQVLWKHSPSSLLPSTGLPGIVFNAVYLSLSFIIRYWMMHGTRTKFKREEFKANDKGHCRREGENRTVKIQSKEDRRILWSGWRREKVRANRQWRRENKDETKLRTAFIAQGL